MTADDEIVIDEPDPQRMSAHERFAQITERMTAALDQQSGEGVRCIIVIEDSGQFAGLRVHGYRDDGDAFVELSGVFAYVRDVMASRGRDLIFLPLT